MVDKKLIKIENKIRAYLLNELEQTLAEEKTLSVYDIEELGEMKDNIENTSFEELLKDFDEEELKKILAEEEIRYLKRRGLI